MALISISGGSGITTWKIGCNGALSAFQSFTFNMSALGPVPTRQEAPHPHEVLVDPSGCYLISNDLGADLLRVFSINRATSALTILPSFKTTPGCGPRHGAFLNANGKTYYFLICELQSTLRSYAVGYSVSGLTFTEVYSSSIYSTITAPAGSAAAEAVLSVSSLLPPILQSFPANEASHLA